MTIHQNDASIVWSPRQPSERAPNLTTFSKHIKARYGLELANYQELYEWSIHDIARFWSEIWDFCGVVGSKNGHDGVEHQPYLQTNSSMIDARFFPQARLNYAENLLHFASENSDSDAILFWAEDKLKSNMRWRELYDAVSQAAQALRDHGVKAGDRVAAYMPNMIETIVLMLASTSIGAIWSSCSPDFGVQGVVDRFGQIEPTVLIAADGYFYAGKEIDNLQKIEEIETRLPSLTLTIIVPFLSSTLERNIEISTSENRWIYGDFVGRYTPRAIEFEQLPFDHPLFILYSSGTTGAPKCIVHGAGGTLLQHLKEHQLHTDICPQDRVFYFTTCTWMMWNWLVSSLASGATISLYDGSPFYPKPSILFDLIEEQKITHFGTSAKYIDALKNEGLVPAETHDLSSMRLMCSTGSPLLSEGFDYVYQNINPSVYLASISGGTDIVSCFVLGDPSSNLYRGEIACRGLGMAVEIWDGDGKPVSQQKGELVCTKPFPSMPVYFWNDQDNEKYHAAYFERFDNIWAQGDYAEITANNGVVIYGRSDATLNPGGVRIGTAEIYRQVEQVDGVLESVVIGQQFDNDVRVVLFVVLTQARDLDDDLIRSIKSRVRSGASPRHVPAVILSVEDIPRTKSGKISELAVRDIVEGRAVKNTTALANPEALEFFKNRDELET